ncbi:MAG: hypothetical protein R3C42_02335 [Parvularculaceae bacterium]
MAARALTIFAMAIVALAMGALPLGGGAAFADSAYAQSVFEIFHRRGRLFAVQSNLRRSRRVRITVYDGRRTSLKWRPNLEAK